MPPSFRKVMITEVTWGDPDGLEITNFGLSSIDLTGWTVRWDDGTVKTSTALNTVLASKESLIVKELSGAFLEAPPSTQVLAVLPAIATTSGDITVALVTDTGLVIDEVRVSDTAGTHAEGGQGGFFRGLAVRGAISTLGGGCVERLWGLDSNSGGDWTEEVQTSMGLESRSSGPRGTDPIPVPLVVINEIDDDPDLIEFRNNGLPVDIENWFVVADGTQGGNHGIVRPWPEQTVFLSQTYMVIGEGPAPAELPGGAPYVDITTLPGFQGLPFTTAEFDCALYDGYGRLVDLVRTTGHDDQVVHNHPRAPSSWSDFGGAAGRNDNSGDRAIGRDLVGTDTNTGADFEPLYIRTMGSQNLPPASGGPAGHGDLLDVRLNATGPGGGLTLIINAGPAYAGYDWSFFLGIGHLNGQGPFLGLGPEAIGYWLLLRNLPPWSGLLDARGSARLDIAPSTIPGLALDTVFILQDAAGLLALRTKVLELDT
jgi:hypothetical protein